MEDKHQPDGELAMQLKRISEQLGFLEKKIDQLLAARVEHKPFGQKPFGQKPYGQKPYGQKSFGQKPYGANRYGGGSQRPDQGFKRSYANNEGRTRTAFYEGGTGGAAHRKDHQGPSTQGHFKKKFQPHRPHRPS